MTLREAFSRKILLLDGGMGSLIQDYHLTEADFRSEQLASIQGNNDVLSVTRPDVVLDIHRRYIAAGADVITTNTFSSQRVSQQEYRLEHHIAELNQAAVRLARQAADEAERPVFVLGDVGPTSKMLSMSEDVNDPAARSITFDELEAAYLEQISLLVAGGVDGILIETIFDTLNAKAALSAYLKVKEQQAEAAPFPEVLLSMTVSDASGRTLSGQTVEAFVTSVLHAQPLCLGLNCGLGAEGMVPYLRQMSEAAPCYVSCHPNAGLPNQFGGYDDTPEQMVGQMQPYFDERLVNMVGGCCGTTPAHIAAMHEALAHVTERRQPHSLQAGLHLSGLEPLYAPVANARAAASMADSSGLFLPVGERCNVAGSRKFLRLISEQNYDEALDIARRQVEDGAQVIDVNMDDGLLDAEREMVTFLNLLASDPAISRVPVMVDSSRFEVIEAGLKCLQGKGIVNSISLKMGEEEFVERARVVKRLGAAVIAMCFDEQGQATDYERRVTICQRMYRLLTEEAGFAPEDIIFDPNVLTVATGMAEHNAYAHDFIRATRWITDNLPGARVSGGLSNLSFAFRGNNYLREAMHSVFLHHARANGMGMAIMNPAAEVAYASIPLELRMAITEVLLDTSPQAPEELIEIAQRMTEAQLKAKEAGVKYDPKAIFAPQQSAINGSSAAASTLQPTAAPAAPATPEERLRLALLKGLTTGLEEDLHTLLQRGDTPVAIISGPLMAGMNEVGRLFGEGKMFLPQVVKTARTMKRAVEILQPYMESASTEASSATGGTLVLATVKGDVHDIGKNIVSVILACNGFRVIDLGVMVPAEQIIEAAIAHRADFVCLSGLITPSLEEMCHVATAMQQAGLRIPLMVGGATTSPIHTAVKIAPCYEGPVFHVRDAASNPGLAMQLLDPATRDEVVARNYAEQQRIREQQANPRQTETGQTDASAPASAGEHAEPASPLERRLKLDWSQYRPIQPPFLGQRVLGPIPVSKVIPFIDWTYFFWPWRVKAESEEGQKLRADADALLADLASDPAYSLRAIQAFYPAKGMDDRIRITLLHDGHEANCPCCRQELDFPTMRQQKLGDEPCLSLCDFVSPEGDYVGAFAATVSAAFIERLERLKREQGNSDYDALLLQTLGDRLAEAASCYLSQELEQQYAWGGIRPAIGYPSLPDQRLIFQLAKLIDFASVGIGLTENGAMYPQASVCGLYIGHPEAQYFG